MMTVTPCVLADLEVDGSDTLSSIWDLANIPRSGRKIVRRWGWVEEKSPLDAKMPIMTVNERSQIADQTEASVSRRLLSPLRWS
jgi:hypothetical protein